MESFNGYRFMVRASTRRWNCETWAWKKFQEKLQFFDLDSESHQRAGVSVHFSGYALRQVGEIQEVK
jgi:hypothetical protein